MVRKSLPLLIVLSLPLAGAALRLADGSRQAAQPVVPPAVQAVPEPTPVLAIPRRDRATAGIRLNF